MTLQELRSKFLAYYEKNGHAIIPSSSLVPENDPTTLFTGSGMQPLVPYLLGQKHPQGTRLVNSQKSFRSGDIDDIGDNRHTTFFEMLGNWSLGDYFKKEQLPQVFRFLTEEVGLDPKRLYVSAFIGDEANGVPKDAEAEAIWKELFASKGIDAKTVDIGSEARGAEIGMQGGRIFFYDVKKNWWSRSGIPANMPAGEPGGPDSELFYEFDFIEHNPKFGAHCHPNCDCGRYIEFGNSVFMQYKKNEAGGFELLPQLNVDFGGGLERFAMAANNTADIFGLDVFADLISTLETKSGKKYKDADGKENEYTAAFRVVVDHIRASVFLIGDGVIPSNNERGYFVRRLLRRAIRYWDKLGINEGGIASTVDALLESYKDAYPETYARRTEIKAEIETEEQKFRTTLRHGLKEIEKIFVDLQSQKKDVISGIDAATLYQSYGFPVELTQELAKEKGVKIDMDGFHAEMKKHQDLSRAGSEKKFKGGLADTSDMSLRYHTATHLLNAALRQVLGDHVGQKGSNITPERLRFDFSHPAKMTDEEKKKVEALVNGAIEAAFPVSFREMPKEEAEKLGAIHAFGEKYGDVVKVYTVGDEAKPFSREFCGGPHVSNTKELAGPEGKARFVIQKEEASSQGIRRIKAVLA
ncbi:MAG: alaS [Candidatus Taylorbacteria bacterium]|nr:alaS [Candidatus Taylorbacteria bacterium]